MSFDLGDTWLLGAVVNDATGTLVNAATVALTITKPDGTTVSPTVTNPPASTGQYVYNYVPTVAGRYTARWVFGFTGGLTESYTDVLDVRPASAEGILSLADAKAHLNKTDNDSDEEIRAFIAAITEIVEADPEFGVGPIVVREYSERVCDGPSWWLRHSPVIALSSVAIAFTSGTPITIGQLVLDAPIGRVQRADGLALTGGPWTVTYTAGRQVIPANVSAAAKVILAHMWETQRGVSEQRRPTVGSDEVQTGKGFSIPHRAVELLRPNRRGPLVG